MSVTFITRFAGSYYVKENDDVCIQSMGQFTAEHDQDTEGNKWVAFSHADSAGDLTGRFKTKKAAIKYVLENSQSFNI